MTLETKESKSLLKKKSALKRKNENLGNQVSPTKKKKKEFASKAKSKKKVHFNIEEKKPAVEAESKITSAIKAVDKETKKPTNQNRYFSKKNADKLKNKKAKSPEKKISNKKQDGKKLQKKFVNKDRTGFLKVKTPKKQQLLKKAERKIIRKKTNDSYELAMKAKRLWELVRCNETRKEKGEQLCEELHKLVKGKVKTLIFAHDTSRVIECLVAVGTDAIRTDLFEELRGEIIKLSKSKYAKFFVMKMLKYGSPSQRQHIMSSFYGDVVNLLKHSEAAAVVECAFNEFANSNQRARLTEEFYGPSFRLFKDREVTNLTRLLSEDPSQKELVLSYMKQNLIPMTQKSVIKHSLIHHVLHEYFTHCGENDREEMIEALKEFLVFFLHSKDGSRVAMQCLWNGNVKVRKCIIKSFKSHVVKICKEEHGHMVLLAIFDCIDDTILINKIILSEIISSLEEIVIDDYGRKVVMYLLSPRDSVFCHGDIIKILQQGDNNPHSKKAKEVRTSELLMKISEPLLNYLTTNVREMVFTTSNNVVAQMIIKHAAGNFSKVYQNIVDLLNEPFLQGNVLRPHIIEHTAGHLILKKLLLRDKEMENSDELFSNYLMKSIPEENYKQWIDCNRGAFFLVRIFEVEKKEIVDFYKNILTPLKEELKKKTFPGANILLKKLEN